MVDDPHQVAVRQLGVEPLQDGVGHRLHVVVVALLVVLSHAPNERQRLRLHRPQQRLNLGQRLLRLEVLALVALLQVVVGGASRDVDVGRLEDGDNLLDLGGLLRLLALEVVVVCHVEVMQRRHVLRDLLV